MSSPDMTNAKDSKDEEQRQWSGEPNGSLVVEVSDNSPGRVLDIGCGEGGDAIWLAKLGWDVTAVDVSSARITRSRHAAEQASVRANFSVTDITTHPPAADAYDLVVLSYPGIERVAGKAAIPAIAQSVVIGGEILVIGHAKTKTRPVSVGGASSKRFDPEKYLSVDDIANIVRPTFTIMVDETRDRPHPPVGANHIIDRILRARRIR